MCVCVFLYIPPPPRRSRPRFLTDGLKMINRVDQVLSSEAKEEKKKPYISIKLSMVRFAVDKSSARASGRAKVIRGEHKLLINYYPDSSPPSDIHNVHSYTYSAHPTRTLVRTLLYTWLLRSHFSNYFTGTHMFTRNSKLIAR